MATRTWQQCTSRVDQNVESGLSPTATLVKGIRGTGSQLNGTLQKQKEMAFNNY